MDGERYPARGVAAMIGAVPRFPAMLRSANRPPRVQRLGAIVAVCAVFGGGVAVLPP